MTNISSPNTFLYPNKTSTRRHSAPHQTQFSKSNYQNVGTLLATKRLIRYMEKEKVFENPLDAVILRLERDLEMQQFRTEQERIRLEELEQEYAIMKRDLIPSQDAVENAQNQCHEAEMMLSEARVQVKRTENAFKIAKRKLKAVTKEALHMSRIRYEQAETLTEIERNQEYAEDSLRRLQTQRQKEARFARHKHAQQLQSQKHELEIIIDLEKGRVRELKRKKHRHHHHHDGKMEHKHRVHRGEGEHAHARTGGRVVREHAAKSTHCDM